MIMFPDSAPSVSGQGGFKGITNFVQRGEGGGGAKIGRMKNTFKNILWVQVLASLLSPTQYL